jgi:hypothetical protein
MNTVARLLSTLSLTLLIAEHRVLVPVQRTLLPVLNPYEIYYSVVRSCLSVVVRDFVLGEMRPVMRLSSSPR